MYSHSSKVVVQGGFGRVGFYFVTQRTQNPVSIRISVYMHYSAT